MENNESEYVEPLGQIQSGVENIETQLDGIKHEFNKVVRLILSGNDIGDDVTPLGDTSDNNSEPLAKLESVLQVWESTIG